MQKKKPFISLVIPAHNNYPSLTRLLKSIKTSVFTHFESIETIIVDDGSTLIKPIPTLPFLVKLFTLKTNKGPAYARNYGVSNAQGTYIIFLDADVVLKKNALQNAYDFFIQKKGKAFTGIWDKAQHTTQFFPQFKALRDHAYWFIEREQNARYYLFSTRIAGIEKKLFNDLGGFNTRYKKPTVEDIEFTYKIEKHTKIMFEPGIGVTHEFEPFVPLGVKYFLRSRDWIKLYMKRLRFDPVATSQKEAQKSIVAGLFTIFLFLSILFQSSTFYLLSSISFLSFLLMEYHFLTFLYKEKDLSFMLRAIPTALVLYIIIDVGSTWGLVEYWWTMKIEDRK